MTPAPDASRTARAVAALRARLLDHLLEVALGVAAAVALAVVGARTPSDVDEGFYALAAELVLRGKVPYRDFFYPQAPYLPYLLAPVAWVSGSRLVVERIAMALCAGATAGLVAFGVRRVSRSGVAAAAAAALYALHELTWQWGPSVRPYAPGTLLAVAAVLLVAFTRTPTWQRCLAAGLLAGVMVGGRLLLLPVALVVVAGAWLRDAEAPVLRALVLGVVLRAVLWAPYGQKTAVLYWAAPVALLALAPGRRFLARGARAAAAAGGMAVALLPALALYLAAPRAFVYGNVGFHDDRLNLASAPDALPWWAQRSTYIFGLFGTVPMNHLSAAGTEFMVMLALALAGLLLGRARALAVPLLAAWAVVLAGLLPMPVHEHYFTPLVPFLALAAGVALGTIAERFHATRHRLALPAALVAVTVMIGWPSFAKRWVHGLSGDWDFAPFRPAMVDAGAAAVRDVARTRPGPVLALWPGSALGLAHRVLPGTENHFGRVAALPADVPDAARRLNILTSRDLIDRVVRREPAVVAFDREAEHEGEERFRTLLVACGYRADAEVPGLVVVYGRDEAPTSDCRPETALPPPPP